MPASTRTLLVADRAVTAAGAVRGATAVLIGAGEILAVGDPAAISEDPRAEGAATLSWKGRALVPGTVNAHNHSFQSLLRGIGDDLPFLEWRERALYRYASELDAAAMESAALFAFGEMLLHGVTTVCDFFYINRQANDNAVATIEAARRLGMRIVLARCFYDWEGAPESFREDPATAAANFSELGRAYPGDARRQVSIHAAPHSQHGATPEMIETGAGSAADAGVPWHIHLAEEAYQVEDSLKRFGARPLPAVARLDVDLSKMIAVHGCWFDPSERQLLAERGAKLAYNPASNMFLGDGITDIIDLRGRGVEIGLGTDGGCSNNRVSVFDEMRTTALLQKVAKCDGQAIDAEECFAMGTEMGGRVLDLPVGRIEAGYRADLVGVDLGDLSLWPEQALAKNLVYSLSPRAIREVMVDGDVVVADGRLLRVDQEEIVERVRSLTSHWRR